jgi:flagellar biosynthesis/type III secretory pathway protein FliH
MADRFVSLATLLQPPPEQRPTSCELAAESPAMEEHAEEAAASSAARDALTFRARLAEAFDDARGQLLTELASEVLARELQLAPAAIDAIAERLVETFGRDGPVALRLSPRDCARVELDIPIEPDSSLRSGDAVLVVRDGELVSSLGVRLDTVLRSAESGG